MAVPTRDRPSGRRNPNLARRSVLAAVLALGVLLSAHAGAAPAASAAATYTLSIDSPGSKPEGDSGSFTMVFHVDVAPNVKNPDEVTVAYATSDGTATGGEDYGSQSGTMIFGQGQSKQNIQIEVFGDTTAEADETFFVDSLQPIRRTQPSA